MRRWYRTIALAIPLLVSLPLPAAQSPSAATSSEPRLILPERPVRATPGFLWRFPVKILNPLEYGVFVDSMWIEIDILDPGETGQAKDLRMPLNIAVNRQPAISAGDSLLFAYSSSAMAESAIVTVQLRARTGAGKKYARSGRVEMHPSQQMRQNRSTLVTVAGRPIEMVCMNGTGGGLSPGPGVVIVHGDGSNARRMIPTAFNVVTLGFSVVNVSLPGYGLSGGPTELAGPASLAAIEAALDTVRAMRGVDSTRIGLWGIGPGAAAVALVAARHPELAAVVLTSGYYDLEAIERETRSATLRQLIRRDAGKTPVEWRARAPIERAAALRMPVLLTHSPLDTVASIDQARAYEAALKSNGTQATLTGSLGAGHFSSPATDQDPEVVFLRDRVQMRYILNR